MKTRNMKKIFKKKEPNRTVFMLENLILETFRRNSKYNSASNAKNLFLAVYPILRFLL